MFIRISKGRSSVPHDAHLRTQKDGVPPPRGLSLALVKRRGDEWLSRVPHGRGHTYSLLGFLWPKKTTLARLMCVVREAQFCKPGCRGGPNIACRKLCLPPQWIWEESFLNQRMFYEWCRKVILKLWIKTKVRWWWGQANRDLAYMK